MLEFESSGRRPALWTKPAAPVPPRTVQPSNVQFHAYEQNPAVLAIGSTTWQRRNVLLPTGTPCFGVWSW